MAFLVSKYKDYKDKKEKEAWDKKLEKYAQKKFGYEEGAGNGDAASQVPASFLRRESNFRRGQGRKQQDLLRSRGECMMVTKGKGLVGKLNKKEEWMDVVLDRGMLMARPLSEGQMDEDSEENWTCQLGLAGSVLSLKKRGFQILRKEYGEDEEVEWQKYHFVPKDNELQEWMIAFSKVPGLLRRLTDYFEVGGVIAEGGTAVVRECIGRYTGTQFALKSIREDAHENAVGVQKMRENLHNELRILQMCDKDQNQSLPKLEDFFYDAEGNLFIVIELLTGGELLDRIMDRQVFTERDAKETIKGVLEGVAYLHSKGVAHRDLKPENLLYSNPGESATLKIIDFDLAKHLSGGTAATPCGTSHYMAPEIVGEYRHSLAVDLWAIGCVTFILLCGRYPFWADTQEEREMLICNCAYQFVPELWEGVSQTAKDFVSALLQKLPHQRLTAHEALQHPWLKNIDDEDEDDDNNLSTINQIRITHDDNPNLRKDFSRSINLRAEKDQADKEKEELAKTALEMAGGEGGGMAAATKNMKERPSSLMIASTSRLDDVEYSIKNLSVEGSMSLEDAVAVQQAHALGVLAQAAEAARQFEIPKRKQVGDDSDSD